MKKQNFTRSMLTFVLTLCLFILGSTQISAQSYVSNNEAVSKLNTELEALSNQTTPGSDLKEEMVKTLSSKIADGMTVENAVETVFQAYENQTSTRPVVANHLTSSKAHIEELLREE